MPEFCAVVLGSLNAEVRFVVFVDRTRCTADRFDQYQNNTSEKPLLHYLNIIMHALLRGSIVNLDKNFSELEVAWCVVFSYFTGRFNIPREFLSIGGFLIVVWTFVSIHHVKPMKQGKLHSFTIHNNLSAVPWPLGHNCHCVIVLFNDNTTCNI